tara:strand:+ start:74 stop:319 length:246 start_codon:yes stop_codon:yes gene_type:complete
MAVVECPHCEEDVEVPAVPDGEYSCPHCEGFLFWENRKKINLRLFLMPIIIQISIFFFVIILFSIAFLLGAEPCKGTGCGG